MFPELGIKAIYDQIRKKQKYQVYFPDYLDNRYPSRDFLWVVIHILINQYSIHYLQLYYCNTIQVLRTIDNQKVDNLVGNAYAFRQRKDDKPEDQMVDVYPLFQ